MSARQKFRPSRCFLDRASNATVVDALPAPVSITEPSNVTWCDGYSKARIRWFGTDAANEAFTIEIYLVDTNVDHPEGHDGVVTYYTTLFTSVAAILGAGVGVAGADVGSDQFLADTIPQTDHALTEIDGAFDGVTSAVWSPATNIWSELIIGSLGATQGFLFRYQGIPTAASFNAVIQLHV